MAHSLFETRLQGIMAVVFIKQIPVQGDEFTAGTSHKGNWRCIPVQYDEFTAGTPQRGNWRCIITK